MLTLCVVMVTTRTYHQITIMLVIMGCVKWLCAEYVCCFCYTAFSLRSSMLSSRNDMTMHDHASQKTECRCWGSGIDMQNIQVTRSCTKHAAKRTVLATGSCSLDDPALSLKTAEDHVTLQHRTLVLNATQKGQVSLTA